MSKPDSADYGLPPKLNETVSVRGTVRTVEALFPDGHYRITLDCDLTGRPIVGVVREADPAGWGDEDEPVCVCGDDAADHVFTGGGFCNNCECERYQAFGTAVIASAEGRA